MKKYAIITAAGKGERMNSSLPKQFHQLTRTTFLKEDKTIVEESKPILLWTIEQFLSLDFEVEILLVLPNTYIERWKDYYNASNLFFKHVIVGGGLTRFHSVKSALSRVPDDAVVAIHDGVRPFASKELITKLFNWQFTDKVAGVIPILKPFDSMREILSIKEESGAVETKSINRDNYLLVQTPQVFDAKKIKEAYTKPYSVEFTDDASVLAASGYEIEYTQGERMNIKITTPEDIKVAQVLINGLNSPKK